MALGIREVCPCIQPQNPFECGKVQVKVSYKDNIQADRGVGTNAALHRTQTDEAVIDGEAL